MIKWVAGVEEYCVTTGGVQDCHLLVREATKSLSPSLEDPSHICITMCIEFNGNGVFFPVIERQVVYSQLLGFPAVGHPEISQVLLFGKRIIAQYASGLSNFFFLY